MNKNKIAIIGSGFSSLAAACYLAQKGHEVHVFEKNNSLGGRARQLKKEGFTFDIGPTFYWMPDIFDRFFADFNRKTSDYYSLNRLDPAYWVYFGVQDYIAVGGSLNKIYEAFENEEKGSAQILEKFINQAAENYDLAIGDLVYKMYGQSPLELVTPKTVRKLTLFITDIKKMVRKRFQNKRLAQILEFPVLFLGAKPSDTPAFYNFMNFADFGLGTWHPKGGMYSVVQGIEKLAKELGVQFHLDHPVEKILLDGKKAVGIRAKGKDFQADQVLSGADYHHSETLLPVSLRAYSEKYWDSKKFAPSSLLFYIGFDKKIEDVVHHTLFFDVDFDTHAHAIYDQPKWPEKPLFYSSFPSKTDDSVAPEGCESCIILIPLAPGLEDTPQLRKQYFDIVISRMETLTKQKLKNNIIFSESFCVNDFVKEYNSYKGNAYGLANTLLQTAFLRPKLASEKVQNLFFTGQLTVPGPGVPPSLISGKLVSELMTKKEK